MKLSLFYLIHTGDSNSSGNSGILKRFQCSVFDPVSSYMKTLASHMEIYLTAPSPLLPCTLRSALTTCLEITSINVSKFLVKVTLTACTTLD